MLGILRRKDESAFASTVEDAISAALMSRISTTTMVNSFLIAHLPLPMRAAQ